MPLIARAQFTWENINGNWSNPANWNPLTPVSGNTTQLIFNASGATSYTTTNDIGTGTFQLNRLTVNNTGLGTVTIGGATTGNTLTFAGTSPTLDITGNTLFLGLLAGSATITKTGTGTFIHDSNNGGFTGTLIIDQGAFINRATTTATTNFNPVSIVVNSGATYQFGENGTGDPNLPNSTYITVNTGGTVVWQEGEVFGGFHLQGGTINLQAGPTASGSTAQNWTGGTITGGNFTLGGTAAINKTSTGTVSLTGNVSITSSGGLNIREGTVALASAANLGTANLTLGHDSGSSAGTLEYQGATATRGGNIGLNAGGGVIKITTATTTLILNGSMFGGGNLSKTGPGRLRLSNTLSGSGTISADEGTLQLDPNFVTNAFAVTSNGILAVNSGDGSFSVTAPSLAVNGDGATLQFDLNTNTIPTAPLFNVTSFDAFTFVGAPKLKLTNLQPFTNGTYTLVDYEGTPITGGFTLSLPGRTAGTLNYDVNNTRIEVSITGTDSVKWTGGTNGDWDAGTSPGVGGTENWKLVGAATGTNYIDTDTITFDDSTTVRTVNLTGPLQPFDTTVDTAGNYTFSGSGKITGTTGLTKDGDGTLVLATNNDYSGGTRILGGTVQLGDGGTTGNLVGAVTINGGQLGFFRSDNLLISSAFTVDGPGGLIQKGSGLVTISTPLALGVHDFTFNTTGDLTLGATLSGTGIIDKSGPGTLTLLANNNAFTGTLNIHGGLVHLSDLGGGGDFGATSIVINSGGGFVFGPAGNADLPDATLVTVNPGGVFRLELSENFGGYILNGGEFRYANANSTAVATLAGNTVYDLRSGTITTAPGATSGGLVQNGSGILTKSTAGTVTVSGAVTFQTTLAMQIKEGVLAMGVANVPSTGFSMITMGDTASRGTWRITDSGLATTSRPLTMAEGGGTVDIASSETTLTLTGYLSGPGSLTTTGPGTVVMTGANDYLGGTFVESGTLEIRNTVDSATGHGPVTVDGTLSGSGSIVAGTFEVAINGTLRIGATVDLQGTDLFISAANVAFGPGSVAQFDLWSATGGDQSSDPLASDVLRIAGNLNIATGATLKLGNPLNLTFQPGDRFRLFDLTDAPTISGGWAVDWSALHLGPYAIDSSNLFTDGTLTVVVPEPATFSFALLGLGLIARCRRRTR